MPLPHPSSLPPDPCRAPAAPRPCAPAAADPSVPRATKIDGLNSILGKMGATDITKNFVGERLGRGGRSSG